VQIRRNSEDNPVKIELTGKTALVTGSSAGIGRAIAHGLAQAGARVVINGRREAATQAALQGLRAQLPAASFQAVAADVATAPGCAALARAVPDVDILVNNAGIFEPKNFFEIRDEDWTRFFETNVMSGVRLSRAYMPGMLKRNWGRIVFISSESALHTPKEMIHYGFTKTAQLALSRGLAELTAGTAVTVNSVLPGPTRSEGVEEFLQQMARETGTSPEAFASQFVKEHRPTSLLQRFASVEEVANLVVYVCSPQASATNGAALRVEGGIVRSIA
jgi:NAD(P)-dependent dehydrogenase (short-subunit alcohol dehydrogenase family)